MKQHYETDHSNQVHQLLVTVSRHYFITKAGKFKQQKKEMDVRLDRLSSKRQYVVHYLIKDHYSGLFYAEVTSSTELFSVYEFLYRAWTEQKKHPFRGAPKAITIPQQVQNVWPGLPEFVIGHGIQAIDVTSGFQGGVREVKTWEDGLRCGLYASGYPPDFTEVREKSSQTCQWLARRKSPRHSKAEIWRQGVKQLLVPATKESFLGAYQSE